MLNKIIEEYQRRLQHLEESLTSERQDVAAELGRLLRSKQKSLPQDLNTVGIFITENAWPRNDEDRLFCMVLERFIVTDRPVSFRRCEDKPPFAEYLNILPSLRDRHFDTRQVSTRDAAEILIHQLQQRQLDEDFTVSTQKSKSR